MENNKNAELREIAEKNGLTYIETTSGSNGYPSNIKGAIIGFETFEEAEKLADEHNLSIEFFKKKDGWQLWERTNNEAHEPMTNSAEDYGDNYGEFEKISESEFIENEILPTLRDLEQTDYCDFEFLEGFISEKKKLFEEIDSMEEDEIVITREGNYHDTIKRNSMYFGHDTKHTIIGLIDGN